MASAVEDLLAQIFGRYRALNRHKDAFAVTQGKDPGDGRQLEYYPPEEGWNPFPGKATVELYNNKESPEVMQNLVAGDMMHFMGGTNAAGKPNDETFWKLKQQLIGSLVPWQKQMDQKAYESEKKFYDNPPAFPDWMQSNRGDAYIRGLLTPDAQDQWKNVYTPKQREILGLIGRYMTAGTLAPGVGASPSISSPPTK